MSTRYVGGLITKTPPTLDPALGNAANGVFTMSQYMQAVKNATWPGFDPYFNQTVLSLHGNGTNGDQNNTFLDSSTNNFTITRNGNTTQGTFSPFSVAEGEWSNYFDGSGDYLTFNSSTVCNFGTSDFTISCWVYLTSALSAAVNILDARASASTVPFVIGIDADEKPYLYDGTNSLTASDAISVNAWNHLSFVRSSGTLNIYINAVSKLSTAMTVNISSTGTAARIGGNLSNSNYFPGYISNFLIEKGTASPPSSVPTSPYVVDANTDFLSCQSNRFVDNSTNAFAITRNGDVKVTPFSPFAPSAAYDPAVNGGSGYFDGSGDYLSVASATALNLSTGAFTLEGWIYPSANNVHLFSRRSSAAARGLQLAYGNITNNKFSFLAGDTNTGAWEVNITSTDTFPFNAWYHVAITRDSSNNFTLWVNGTSQATTNSNVTIADDASNLLIGGIDNTGTMNGYLSNLRLVKGRAVYTSAFTPSTSPLGATSGGQDPPQGTETGLLTCQSNRFVDNSTNAFAITRNGDVRVTPFSPFAPSAAYDPAVNGGSGYLDGTSDYLTVSNTGLFGSGDWHVECWVNAPVGQVDKPILECRNSASGNGSTTGFTLTLITATEIRVWSGAERLRATASYVGTWVHVAVSKKSGTTRLYINGTSLASTTSIGTMSDTTFIIGAGYYGSTSLNAFGQFWISGLRVLTGTGFDTSTITIPTAPPTAITNTSLLLNFTNAGIFDNTGKNNLETVGNAQIDTTTKKFGTGSMEFDGTGDYLVAPADQRNIEFLTGDFTIECWIRFAVVQNSQIVTGLTAANTIYWQYFSSQLAFGQNNVANIAATNWSPSVNTWYHIAVTRSGTTVRQFVDGVQLGSNVTSSASFPNGPIQIGFGGAGYLNGFIDDLRITKGVARYTSNFTPPTQAFSDF